jgi:hypothetical protein
MNHQTVVITMPEPLYQRLQRWSTVIQRPLENVVLQTLQTTLPKLPEELSNDQRHLWREMERLTDDQLWQTARSTMPLPQQDQYRQLREKHGQDTLNTSEQTQLEEWYRETHLLMLRKAYAYVLLKWRGYSLPTLTELAEES